MLSVPYSHQDETRRTEEEVNMLFDTWRRRFPEKDDRELLAMIAFRYADHYAALKRERLETQNGISTLTKQLETVLAVKNDMREAGG